jgi:hypothetical protein
MGSFFSLFDQSGSEGPICPLCNKATNKLYIYSQMTCSKCKEINKSYNHKDCWHDYIDKVINNKKNFICPKCYFDIENN